MSISLWQPCPLTLDPLAASHCGATITRATDLAVFAGQIVFRGRKVAELITKGPAWLLIELAERVPLEAIQAIVRAVAFVKRDRWRPRGASKPATRVAELVIATSPSDAFTSAGAKIVAPDPVRRLMPLRLSQPLVAPSDTTATLTYHEGTGARPLAVFDVAA